MEAFQAFDADVQKLPQWVQMWMDFIGMVLVVSTVALLIGKTTRGLGLYMLGSTVVVVAIMTWMHSQMGMVRLLGIVHVVFWTPLVIYLWRRLRDNPPSRFYWVIMVALGLTCTAALVFDYYDVFRWIVGQRAPIV
ncbi:MAG: hypothetical protein ABJM29_01080 [Rhizobiaceae bacterium]